MYLVAPIHQRIKNCHCSSELRRVLDGSHLLEDWGFPFWIISHAGTNITYSHQHMHLDRQLAYERSLQTESNQNKHWTTLLTIAPGNPISQYDMRHD